MQFCYGNANKFTKLLTIIILVLNYTTVGSVVSIYFICIVRGVLSLTVNAFDYGQVVF